MSGAAARSRLDELAGQPNLWSIVMKKQEVLDMLDRFPEDVDPEQLMHELYLKAKLDRAEAAVARGETVPHDEVVQRSRKWSE